MRRALGVVLVGTTLMLVALAFDAPPLLVPGIAFILLGAVAPVWVQASAAPVTLRRELDSGRVVEDEPLEATIDVRRGWLGLPRAELRDPLVQEPVPLTPTLSLVRGGRSARVRIVARFSRRGLHHVQAPSLFVRDPLALAGVARAGSSSANEVLVLPRTERIRWAHGAPGHAARRVDGRTLAEPTAAVEVDGLRPYRPGTPASRIHWAALARGAGLLERRLRADRDARPLVVLDARGTPLEEELDAAVRAAASLTLELARRGGCRLLIPGERRAFGIEPDLLSWPTAHAKLALVESGPATRPPLLDTTVRTGAVFYVSAQPLERMPPALSAPGRGAVVVVLPIGVGAPPASSPSFEVAGCRGFLVRFGSEAGAMRPSAVGDGARRLVGRA